MVFRRFSYFEFVFWFHILNSNFAKYQNLIKINIVQNLTKTSTILLHTNFPRPTNFIQFYPRALIVSVFIISPISPLNLQYLAIKFDKNQKIVLPFKIIIRDSYSSKEQNLWFLSPRNRDFWWTNYRKIRLFFFAVPRRYRCEPQANRNCDSVFSRVSENDCFSFSRFALLWFWPLIPQGIGMPAVSSRVHAGNEKRYVPSAYSSHATSHPAHMREMKDIVRIFLYRR